MDYKKNSNKTMYLQRITFADIKTGRLFIYDFVSSDPVKALREKNLMKKNRKYYTLTGKERKKYIVQYKYGETQINRVNKAKSTETITEDYNYYLKIV